MSNSLMCWQVDGGMEIRKDGVEMGKWGLRSNPLGLITSLIQYNYNKYSVRGYVNV